MKLKLQVTDDTCTPYLEYIRDAVNAKRDDFVKNAAKTVAYTIAGQGDVIGQDDYGQYGTLWGGVAPYNTGALLTSALNPNQQVLSNTETQSIVDLYWTGMYADYSWKEFRSDRDTSKPPERDYARYQETGEDINASSRDAKHKGFFTSMLKKDKGTRERVKYNLANEYMKVLMKR